MPLSYDEIERGRRREWDKLQDPKERAEREKEAAKDDPEQERKISGFDLRQKRRKEAREADLVRWKKTKRDAVILLTGTIILILTVFGIQAGIKWAVRDARAEKAAELAKTVESGKPYASFNDPYEAWASWRSAWLRRDAKSILRTYSPGMREREVGRLTDAAYIIDLQKQIQRNNKEHIFEVVQHFRNPIIVRPGSGSPNPGELAVLKTQPVLMKSIPMSTPQVWVLAISYDKVSKEWRIEDLRSSDAWSDSWKNASHLSTSRKAAE